MDSSSRLLFWLTWASAAAFLLELIFTGLAGAGIGKLRDLLKSSLERYALNIERNILQDPST